MKKKLALFLAILCAMVIPAIAQNNQATQTTDWEKVPAGWTHDDRYKGWSVRTTLNWGNLGAPPTAPCDGQNAYRPSEMSLRQHKVNVHETRKLEKNTWVPMWTAGNIPKWVCQLKGTEFDFDKDGRRLYRTDCGNPAPEFPRTDVGPPHPAPAAAPTPVQPAAQAVAAASAAPTPVQPAAQAVAAASAAPTPAVCSVTELSIITYASARQKLLGGIPDMLISTAIAVGGSAAYSSGNRLNSALTASYATLALNRAVNWINPDHNEAKVSASNHQQTLKLKKGDSVNLGEYTIVWSRSPNQIRAISNNPGCPAIVIEPKNSTNITPVPWLQKKTAGAVIKDSSPVRRIPQ